MKLTGWEFIIIMAGVVFVNLYWFRRIYYLRKNNLITFVVRFKNGITHYIDLQENTTRDELIKLVIRISGEEETNIVGIYNLYGDELEYIKGVWVEK